ncbi:MAG: M28 family peptidase [Verrucomicrobiales bacterium]|nr:M28 family peptidase [Verrucomicrobiales bacterium]
MSQSFFSIRFNRVRSRIHEGSCFAWRESLRVILILLLGLASPVFAEETPETREAVLMSGIRQLTFEGKRAGEGYFSADGTKMVFQSEREEGNPFYQIYLLDLETGDTERISPGMGKTTCAWIHPDGTKVMFASTHSDPASEDLQKAEYEERESATARKYSWDYDAEFEIYEYDLESGEYRNLTNVKGYDAEGAYSGDGKHIIFASNRQAYDGSMSEADQKFFKLDKKFPMEIYISDADGSNVKRLTETDGYDGGPFFSADSKKICWRRFDRKGLTAEIFTMNIDGTEERQLTHLGAMSWAPFFHPSGEYLIFGTNKHGFDNFELYLVDAAGEKDPVRVTYTKGFDGLPTFSPDGETISWTTNRTPSKESQIFLAKWNHEEALNLLSGSESAGGVTLTEAPDENELEGANFDTVPSISKEDIRNHIAYLASPELEGRLTGTKGEQLATEHVAEAFKEWGLEPGGDDGSYYQSFEFTAGVAVGEDNNLSIKVGDETLSPEVDKDWRPVSFSKTGDVNEAGIVFAGYGLEVPDGKGGESYTSYFHLDVKGKWVMVFRFVPDEVDDETRQQMQRYSRLRHKAALARRKFAAGIIFVSGPEAEVNEELVPMQFDASLADSGIPAISMSNEMAARLIASAGKDFSEVQKTLNTGEMVQGFEVPGARLKASIDVDQEKRQGRNVIGVLSAGQTAAHPNPAVVVGAHIDHLGTKAGPGSLAKEEERNQIHFGADDNASGVAGLMEIAEYLADLRKQGKLDMKRDVVFAGWSGEEIGLLGSSHFVRKLAKDYLGEESAPLGLILSSYLNMDMIGRLDGNLVLQGTGSSDYWEKAIEQRNAPIGLPITIQPDTFLPTDATSFYLRKIPILSAFTGAHKDYHTPRDTVDKINYDGTTDIVKLMGLITRGLAIDSEAPKYLKVDPPKNRGARGFRVYLGTIPDYSQGEVKGVMLSGVSESGPAGVAGVKGGDIIVGLGGRKILNIYDYTDAMAALKVGEETEIVVQRDEEEISLKLTPGSRD